jgi:hypothetical protein
MGGSAFHLDTHGFTTSRMDKSQYTALSNYLLPLLRLYFRNVSTPPEAPGKETFGDLDIMVSQPLDLHPHEAILQICSRVLGDKCKKFLYNSPTTNIAVAIGSIVAQVDVHVVPNDELWGVDFWMHSWGDVGMIVSSTIKAWGLRLSASRGLWVEVPGGSPLTLSLDIERIILFLGLDWERYSLGFDTLEEIYEWVEQIRINGARIGVKSGGKADRREHLKRPMWVAYWKRGNDARYDPSDEEKNQVFDQALEYFGKREEYEDIIKQTAREKLGREKFNGFQVREWTGTDGKRLGMLMKALKEDGRLNKDSVVEMKVEDIRSIVMDVWKGLS